jgi:hypothetical protein
VFRGLVAGLRAIVIVPPLVALGEVAGAGKVNVSFRLISTNCLAVSRKPTTCGSLSLAALPVAVLVLITTRGRLVGDATGEVGNKVGDIAN